ncbi:phosphonate ABC transporter substrate-binding protein [Asticcacaulis sp. AC460]|uniref:phosphate/phosphite/phosphonate ABC transporter substrate-binding protein n=1 Tax=Asticcacaulis sp. AC460 TaxID=1282360 RepID=UPI0003C3B223|nr:phosphate/phosphite/phosphonate ABC transporter substrate-binding protein [Asticcacaulis sp. AC460]ESQ90742.1 phosphonate ABC transporter substrate-binding protein [Asticcacaulis sp. AC460]
MTQFTRQSVLTGLFAAAGATLAACDKPAAGGKQVVNFSVLSVEKSQTLNDLWTPFFDDMRKQTGLEINPYFAPDYTALIEGMRFKKVQAGWFSNVPGLDAIRIADGEVFAETIYPEGFAGYYSIIIAKADSKLTVDDVLKCDKSLNFGMGDAKSTSGTQAPLYYLFVPKKIEPKSCFKTVLTQGHGQNIQAVANGVLDAATNNTTALVDLESRDPVLRKKVKVIWQSPEPLPNDVIIYRKDLDPVVKEKLRSFFLSYGRAPGAEGERQRNVLKPLVLGGFIPGDNSHFIPVRLMEASTKLMIAQQSGDAAEIKKAQDEFAAIEKEKAAHDALTPMQAPADPSSSSAS